jgi:hypothetical protein
LNALWRLLIAVVALPALQHGVTLFRAAAPTRFGVYRFCFALLFLALFPIQRGMEQFISINRVF